LNLRTALPWIFRLPDIRPGEGSRLLIMFALLFFLIAANNIIKVVRDSIFLSQHAATELPYVYLYSGFLAGLSIAFYGRYASRILLDRLMMGSLAFVTLGVLFFWYLLEFHDAGWVHYAFYFGPPSWSWSPSAVLDLR
jgi:ATP/ADP translocase